MTDVIWVSDREEFLELIATNREVLVDFTAPGWCVPCQRFAPHFDSAATNSDVIFVAVDVDKAPWAMEDYGVRGVPTVKFFRDASVVGDLKERTAIKLLDELSRL